MTNRQYRKGRRNRNNKISKQLRTALKKLRKIISEAKPREIRPRLPKGSHHILYTDGMEESGHKMGIGGNLIKNDDDRYWFKGHVPERIKKNKLDK